jgi:hypothetical protein
MDHQNDTKGRRRWLTLCATIAASAAAAAIAIFTLGRQIPPLAPAISIHHVTAAVGQSAAIGAAVGLMICAASRALFFRGRSLLSAVLAFLIVMMFSTMAALAASSVDIVLISAWAAASRDRDHAQSEAFEATTPTVEFRAALESPLRSKDELPASITKIRALEAAEQRYINEMTAEGVEAGTRLARLPLSASGMASARALFAAQTSPNDPHVRFNFALLHMLQAREEILVLYQQNLQAWKIGPYGITISDPVVERAFEVLNGERLAASREFDEAGLQVSQTRPAS